MNPVNRILLGVAACLTLVAGFAASTPAQADRGASVWYVIFSNETEGAAIARAAQVNPEVRQAVASLLPAWSRKSPAGMRLTMAEIEMLKAATTSGGVSVQAVVPTDPNTFPVVGDKGSDKSYWLGIDTEVVGKFCSSSSCTVTDRIAAKGTINPGTISSRFDLSYLYSPNAGNFTKIVYRLFAVCRGAICDTSGRIDPAPKSASHTLDNYGNRAGNRLTLARGLEVYAPRQGWVYNGSKTEDCLGRTGTDHRCYYIY